MTEVTVMVDDAHLPSIRSVADQLTQRGMQVDRVLAMAGCITGSIESGAESRLRAIPGVASVDANQEFQLPDPSSEIQ